MVKETILRDTLQKPGPDSTPLFKNASKLAEAVVNLPNSGYGTGERDQRSVAAFLSQIFRGERSCPKKLEELLVTAVQARLSKQKAAVLENWTEAIRLAIQRQNEVYE